MRISISIMPISLPNPMFDHLLESSHRDDSNKWSNIGFGEDITQIESIEFILSLLSGALKVITSLHN